ncbi:uncharacterized protein SEPMUDRAFT_119654 [Sphaerulina musiva SO2202]|uniref:Uncharacterized protein n=1 Tax=Sphaerulina musiva (strain SO2202) TaxID=692275 RepID=M3BTD0_SPHMS|nr:uncharacterized protein SEPMUDRAFT_119654 [Sphaerulina musiva SO2202]EMF09915.1 hypothetical protein SEPMUDRAFT_119654 [Sphaerulina musiva SO2202]
MFDDAQQDLDEDLGQDLGEDLAVASKGWTDPVPGARLCSDTALVSILDVQDRSAAVPNLWLSRTSPSCQRAEPASSDEKLSGVPQPQTCGIRRRLEKPVS